MFNLSKSLVFFALLVSAPAALAEVYVFTGVYQGKDLYVKNPFSPDGVGFCVFEVRVNGETTSDEVNSSAFAIDLALFNLAIGTPVEVVIRSKDSCEPLVVNPEAIAPRSTFELDAFAMKDGETLRFTTIKESGALPFVVEQFKWNKWVAVAGFEGRGGKQASENYEVMVPVHHGTNQFRISQTDAIGTRSSKKFEVQGGATPVTLVSNKVSQTLEFSAATDYEVYDAYGILVARGFGIKVDASRWRAGDHYVNFDATFGAVVRKR